MNKGQNLLLENCVAVLQQGISLLELLSDGIFRKLETGEKACVGTHFRHNLDFVSNFLTGLETGKIDYNLRERNYRVETDRQYAISRFRTVIERLENLPDDFSVRRVFVLSETVEDLWCESSVWRELEFLQSHTIHHYALIVEKLVSADFVVPEDFGVAPSTLKYWKSREIKAKTA